MNYKLRSKELVLCILAANFIYIIILYMLKQIYQFQLPALNLIVHYHMLSRIIVQ